MSSHVNTDDLSDADRRLFDDFVKERRRDPRTPERAPVDGISSRTLRRYLDGDRPTRLADDTKLAMSKYLASKGVEGYERFSYNGTPVVTYEVRESSAPASAATDLRSRLDAIEALDVDELVKLVKIEALSAAIRAEAALIEATAAATRARAVERAEIGSLERAVAIRQAEESAARRASAFNSDASTPAQALLAVESALAALQREVARERRDTDPRPPDNDRPTAPS